MTIGDIVSVHGRVAALKGRRWDKVGKRARNSGNDRAEKYISDVTRIAFHNYLPRAARIRFYDTSGSLVLQERLGSVSELVDMSGLQTGVYVYEVWDGETRLVSGKVVKI